MVYGIEGNWADFSGSNVSTAFPAIANGTKTHASGLLTDHIGYAFDTVLLYTKGGAAVTATYHIDLVATGTELAKSNDVRWGGALGAGAEVSITPAPVSWRRGCPPVHAAQQRKLPNPCWHRSRPPGRRSHHGTSQLQVWSGVCQMVISTRLFQSGAPTRVGALSSDAPLPRIPVALPKQQASSAKGRVTSWMERKRLAPR
ncbi:outer membrane protein [Bradyrhizobium glycinis]|uniref:outer membrane protein n=1 Tax=Bradyrhizobium glycinis TaxID=2751812 RepID=UPI001FE7E984|nr:hypothetical protein [Bradyrhizobium glycinis]